MRTKPNRTNTNMERRQPTSTTAAVASSLSNDVIRTRVVRNYRQFVADVDPRGGIMDFLIEAGVVSIETKDRIVCQLTRQDRCRTMLDELLGSSHPQAFIVLHRAVEEHYSWIADKLKKTSELDAELASSALHNSPEGLNIADMARRLRDLELELKSVGRNGNSREPNGFADCDLRQQLDAAQNTERHLREQLAESLQRERDLQGQLAKVRDSEESLKRKVKELSDRERELTMKLESTEAKVRDLESRSCSERELDLKAKLEDSLELEKLLKAQVDEATLREKLLRLEVKQAVEDERTLMTERDEAVQPGGDVVDSSSVYYSPEFSRSPTLVRILPGFAAVYGVTALNGELFVVRDRTNVIEVYEMTTLERTHQLAISHSLAPKPPCPLDLVSCSMTSSLYVSDYANCRVHRLQLRIGCVTNSWRVEGRAWGLSVTSRATLWVCCRGSGRLCEYTSEGSLVREVTVSADILHPVHAVELDARFTGSVPLLLVCHGDEQDAAEPQKLPLHRVCAVDASGNVVAAHGSVPGSSDQLVNHPHHLAVTKDGLLLVADSGNNRVKLLDPTRLDGVVDASLVTEQRFSARPHRLAVCSATSRLLVGLWDGRVLVYQLSADGSTLHASANLDIGFQLRLLCLTFVVNVACADVRKTWTLLVVHQLKQLQPGKNLETVMQKLHLRFVVHLLCICRTRQIEVLEFQPGGGGQPLPPRALAQTPQCLF